MNHESRSIWTKPHQGLPGAVFGGLNIVLAAAVFGGAATAAAYIVTPRQVLIWAGVDAAWVWQTPGVVPALITLQVMGLFLALAVPAVLLYEGVKRLLRREPKPLAGTDTRAAALRQEP